VAVYGDVVVEAEPLKVKGIGVGGESSIKNSRMNDADKSVSPWGGRDVGVRWNLQQSLSRCM